MRRLLLVALVLVGAQALGDLFEGNQEEDNFICIMSGGIVCAQDTRNGHCAHHWSQSDNPDPMWACQNFLGRAPSKFNKGNYRCRDTGEDAWCAQDVRTGECKHLWVPEDSGNPEWDCKHWVQKLCED